MVVIDIWLGGKNSAWLCIDLFSGKDAHVRRCWQNFGRMAERQALHRYDSECLEGQGAHMNAQLALLLTQTLDQCTMTRKTKDADGVSLLLLRFQFATSP